MDITLTEEQKKFLEECEAEFKDRYTENDPDFMKIKTAAPKRPPIMDPWYSKPRRPQNDWSQQNQDRDRGRRNHHWDRKNHDRDRLDKHAGKQYLQHHRR